MDNKKKLLIVVATIVFALVAVVIIIYIKQNLAPEETRAAAVNAFRFVQTSPAPGTNIGVNSSVVMEVYPDLDPTSEVVTITELVMNFDASALQAVSVTVPNTLLYLALNTDNNAGRISVDITSVNDVPFTNNTLLATINFTAVSVALDRTTVSIGDGATLGYPDTLDHSTPGAQVIRFTYGAGVCGDNMIQAPNASDLNELCDGNSEACQIGGYPGTSACNATCTGFATCVATESCGDSIINGPEVCDDGNTAAGDTCAADCSAVTTVSSSATSTSTSSSSSSSSSASSTTTSSSSSLSSVASSISSTSSSSSVIASTPSSSFSSSSAIGSVGSTTSSQPAASSTVSSATSSAAGTSSAGTTTTSTSSGASTSTASSSTRTSATTTSGALTVYAVQLTVRDKDGHLAPMARVQLTDSSGSTFQGTTTASGSVVINSVLEGNITVTVDLANESYTDQFWVTGDKALQELEFNIKEMQTTPLAISNALFIGIIILILAILLLLIINRKRINDFLHGLFYRDTSTGF